MYLSQLEVADSFQLVSFVPSSRYVLQRSPIAVRSLRTFALTREMQQAGEQGQKKRNIPIQAIGLSLYEEVGAFDGSNGLAQAEKLGKEVVRTQWLDFSTLGDRPLIGRKILIVVSARFFSQFFTRARPFEAAPSQAVARTSRE